MLNGSEMGSEPTDNYHTMMALAAGKLEEDAFAAWIQAHLQPLPA